MSLFLFFFCIPDSCALSLCFLSTITLFLHHIVSSVVWRNVYKDSVHPLVKQAKTYSPKFRSVQSSQAQYQWYKLRPFYLSINREKRNVSLLFLVDNLFPSVLSSKKGATFYPSSLYPFTQKPSIHSVFLIHPSCQLTYCSMRQNKMKADLSYIRPVDLEDTTPTPFIYIKHP